MARGQLRKPVATKATVSIAVMPSEAETIKNAASALEISTSAFIAMEIKNAIAQGEAHLAYVAKQWTQRMTERLQLPGAATRSQRVSTVMREYDRDLIADVAKKHSTTAHAMMQAIAIVAAENPRTGSSNRPDAPVAPSPDLEPMRQALVLLSKTLSAFLIRPERAPDLEAKLRRVIGVPEGERLSSAHIMAAALKAGEQAAPKEDKRNPEYGNVVTLSDAVAQLEPRPKFKVKQGRVFDQWGNSASIDVFGSQAGAEKALESLRNCVGCTDCVECEGCRNCVQCGRCRDCVGCKACVQCVQCIGCTSCEGMRGVHGFDGNATE